MFQDFFGGLILSALHSGRTFLSSVICNTLIHASSRSLFVTNTGLSQKSCNVNFSLLSVCMMRSGGSLSSSQTAVARTANHSALLSQPLGPCEPTLRVTVVDEDQFLRHIQTLEWLGVLAPRPLQDDEQGKVATFERNNRAHRKPLCSAEPRPRNRAGMVHQLRDAPMRRCSRMRPRPVGHQRLALTQTYCQSSLSGDCPAPCPSSLSMTCR